MSPYAGLFGLIIFDIDITMRPNRCIWRNGSEHVLGRVDGLHCFLEPVEKSLPVA